MKVLDRRNDVAFKSCSFRSGHFSSTCGKDRESEHCEDCFLLWVTKALISIDIGGL